mmetsp:Transcript_172036/g.546019  ORF Transcript_172036/g.546019 Transcript_172036/m.546019 type:complete len:148 (-) Transcript_172036:57-500(-)
MAETELTDTKDSNLGTQPSQLALDVRTKLGKHRDQRTHIEFARSVEGRDLVTSEISKAKISRWQRQAEGLEGQLLKNSTPVRQPDTFVVQVGREHLVSCPRARQLSLARLRHRCSSFRRGRAGFLSACGRLTGASQALSHWGITLCF